MTPIKIGFTVSYDWYYLKKSLPFVYKQADKIILAVDKDRKTWGGNSYTLSNEFFTWVKEFDINKKIVIYEDQFYYPDKGSAYNRDNTRKMMTDFMGVDCWRLQLDVDEYFLNFSDYVNFLNKIDSKSISKNKSIAVYVNFLTIFKELNDGFIIINENGNQQELPVAIKTKKSLWGRGISEIDKKIHTNFFIFHQSWAKDEKEIEQKINNWGHKNDFNTKSYFNLWKAIDKDNFKYITNFHPIANDFWNSLVYYKAEDIKGLLECLKYDYSDFYSRKQLLRKNSKVYKSLQILKLSKYNYPIRIIRYVLRIILSAL